MSANPAPLSDAELDRIGHLLRADDRFEHTATRELVALLTRVIRAARRVHRKGGSREEMAPVAVYQELLIHVLDTELTSPEHTPEQLALLGVRRALYLSRDRLEALTRMPVERRPIELRRWRDSRLNRVDKDWFVRSAGRMTPPEYATDELDTRASGLSQATEDMTRPPSTDALDAQALFRRSITVALLHNTPKLKPSPPPPSEVARKRWRDLARRDPAVAVTSATLELPDYPALRAETDALMDAMWRVHYQASRGGGSWPRLLHPLGAAGAARATTRVACWMLYGALLAENGRDAGQKTYTLLTDWGYRLRPDTVSPYFSKLKKDIERALGGER